MILILFQVLILEYSISALEDLPNRLNVLGENDSKTNTLVENEVSGLTFDRRFAEHSWNGPTDVDAVRDAPEVGYITMEKLLLDPPYKHTTKLASIESNLELKMDEEWLEKDPKFSYKSHIYIGTSKFPLSFKTSRIINSRESALGLLGGLEKPESKTTNSNVKKSMP